MTPPTFDHVFPVRGVLYGVTLSADRRSARISPDLPTDEMARLDVMGHLANLLSVATCAGAGVRDEVELLQIHTL